MHSLLCMHVWLSGVRAATPLQHVAQPAPPGPPAPFHVHPGDANVIRSLYGMCRRSHALMPVYKRQWARPWGCSLCFLKPLSCSKSVAGWCSQGLVLLSLLLLLLTADCCCAVRSGCWERVRGWQTESRRITGSYPCTSVARVTVNS